MESFYIQPFKWEEDVERNFKDKGQIIHCWAKAIPADPDGTPLGRETTTTHLFRIKNYPSSISIIVPQTYTVNEIEKPTREIEVREIVGFIENWVTSPHGMKVINREEYMNMRREWVKMETHYQSTYSEEYSPIRVDWERRRRVYYYKRLPDGTEQTDFVINVHFRNKTVSQKFMGAGFDGFMGPSYADNRRLGAFTKKIMGKIYKFDQGFRGIDSVQKLLTERKVNRCGWFFVRDVVSAKPAERICPRGSSKRWINEFGSEVEISNHVPEYFMDCKSIFPADEKITRTLLSIPSVLSWDIECYSDNHKAMPVAWNGRHVAYIITAVYQQYKKPETRIRKAFVLGKCDYTTPTENDGKTSALVECKTEVEMIDSFSKLIQDLDADILIGYNIFGFDINYLDVRLERNVRKWSNMGRLRENITYTGFTDWSSSAYGKNQLYWIEAPGRMCVDMMKIIERDYKFSDYKLETVSNALLGKGKNDVSPQEMFRIYELCLNNEPHCESEMLRVVRYGIQDAVLPIELFEKINAWPFFIESANVMCVNPMDLFTRGQQVRLLNQFYDKCLPMGFVIDGRKVNTVEAVGAYVVPPIRGMHENVMTLDFASLYPSIMIAHNIGHDTLVVDDSIPDDQCHVFEWMDDEETALNKDGNFEADGETPLEEIGREEEENPTGKPEYKIRKTPEGKWRFRFIREDKGHRSIAATMLVDLLGARKAVRAEQKLVRDSDPVYWNILEQRQKAIKVSCNSVYGMLLAQETGKLPLAEGGICTTFRGRQLNLEMQRIAMERYGAITAYGDTDSIMVKTPYTNLFAKAGSKFGEQKPSMDQITDMAKEENFENFSTEIAQRFLEQYTGVTREYEVCKDMGDVIARDISSHLPKPISLEFENVFVKALFLMKKRYACILLDMDKMVVKADPYKIYTKGIMLARRDNCAWARNLFRDALFNILMGKSRVEISLIVHSHIQNLLTWNVPLSDLEIIQKLGFDYKSETFPLKLFSEHLANIGKPARPNDRLAFIVSSTPNQLAGEDPKLGHYYRLSETLRNEISEGKNTVNYLYYVERLNNDLNQIFSIGFMEEIKRDNTVVKHRVSSSIRTELEKLEASLEDCRKTLVAAEDELSHFILEGPKKKEVECRRKTVAVKRRIKAMEAEQKKHKSKLDVLEKKGVEEYVRKTRSKNNVIQLSLDEKMFQHILDYLTSRKNLLKEILSKRETQALQL